MITIELCTDDYRECLHTNFRPQAGNFPAEFCRSWLANLCPSQLPNSSDHQLVTNREREGLLPRERMMILGRRTVVQDSNDTTSETFAERLIGSWACFETAVLHWTELNSVVPARFAKRAPSLFGALCLSSCCAMVLHGVPDGVVFVKQLEKYFNLKLIFFNNFCYFSTVALTMSEN